MQDDLSAISTALPPSEIFTLFFVTLGPIKMLAPYAQRTRHFTADVHRKVAVRAFIIATAAALVGGLFGQSTLMRWHIPIPVLMTTAGVVLFAVALRQVLQQYDATDFDAEPLPSSPTAAVMRVVFPLVLTPYGIAAVIVLLAESTTPERKRGLFSVCSSPSCFSIFSRCCWRGAFSPIP